MGRLLVHGLPSRGRRTRQDRSAESIREGVPCKALKGALHEIARLGGGTVESYPEDVEGRSVAGSDRTDIRGLVTTVHPAVYEAEGGARNSRGYRQLPCAPRSCPWRRRRRGARPRPHTFAHTHAAYLRGSPSPQRSPICRSLRSKVHGLRTLLPRRRCRGVGLREPLRACSENGSNGVNCNCSIKTRFAILGSTDRSLAHSRPKRRML